MEASTWQRTDADQTVLTSVAAGTGGAEIRAHHIPPALQTRLRKCDSVQTLHFDDMDYFILGFVDGINHGNSQGFLHIPTKISGIPSLSGCSLDGWQVRRPNLTAYRKCWIGSPTD